MLLFLVRAGWEQGQLLGEILQNAWLNREAHPSILFEDPPENRWCKAARFAGVDILGMTSQVGYA